MQPWLSRLSLVLMLLLAWYLPAPAPAAPSILDSYDAAHVDTVVNALADEIGVRAAGTLAERQAAAVLADRFAQLGLSTYLQPFEVVGRQSQNVIATIPGDPAYGTIIIGAHYDTVPTSPGANDNASSVAVLLESARLLSSQPVSPTLTFIAFGAEERAAVGSAHYALRQPSFARRATIGMLNLDCVGVGDRQVVQTVEGTDNSLVERVLDQARQLGIHAEPPSAPTDASDHQYFARLGIPSAFIATATAEGLCGPDLHRATDTAEKLDPMQLRNVAALVIATSLDLAAQAQPSSEQHLWLPAISE